MPWRPWWWEDLGWLVLLFQQSRAGRTFRCARRANDGDPRHGGPPGAGMRIKTLMKAARAGMVERGAVTASATAVGSIKMGV